MGDNLWFTLLFAASFLATLDADVGPKFINNPEPIVVPLGDEVEFECSLDIRADYVRWRHNGRLLPYVFNETAKSQLIFKMSNESQIGDYQCIAWFGVSAIASNPARLSLAELGPIPPKSYKSLIVSPGNNIVIKCRVPYSNPAAVIQYYKNNETLQASQILNSGTLLLTNVSSRDNGQYTCSVTNTYVREDAIFLPSYDTLNVVKGLDRKPPQFSYPPQSRYNVQAGANITLECVAHGEPVPKVSWRKKGGTLPKDRYSITAAGLRLVNISSSDEGVYVCEMNNGVSPVLIHNVEVFLQEPAVVEKGPENHLVKEGGKVRLECVVRGKPPPKTTWLLNGESVRNDSHIVTNGSIIQIREVEKRHAGMYQCMAENELGSSFGSSTLQVEPRQVTAKSPSDLNGFSQDSYYREKSRHTVSRPHGINKQKKLNKSKGEMVPPSRPNVTRLTRNSVMVRWHVTPNKGLPILFFKVQHRELAKGKGSRWMTNNEDIPPHVGSYEVIGLTPDRYYRFRIAAVYSNYDNKLSPNSARFYLHAGSGKQIPAAPRLTHTSAVGPEAIQIVWEYQNNSKVRIEGFYVYYRATSTAEDYIKATIEGERTRSYVVTHLAKDTFYDIKLQSFAVNAASEFSEIVTQKTEQGPTVRPPTTEPVPTVETESDETSKSSNQLYVTLGAALGGLALLLMLCLGIFFCNKHRHTTSGSQDGDGPDKSRHIQLEPINVNGHLSIANGHVPKTNGYLSSKMNITSNPLADTDEDKNQNVMEISFIARTSTMTTTTTTNQNNNCPHNRRSRPEMTSQNKTETASSSKIEINHKVSQICEGSYSSSDECSLNDTVLPSCGLESDSWRRCDVGRTVENYV